MFPKINLRALVSGLFLCFFVSFVLFYGRQDWFGTSYPATTLVRDYYLTHAVTDTGAKNVITAVYLDYRLFATLFETMLLFSSVIAVFYFSRHQGDHE